MSLYNQIFGTNPASDMLLAMLKFNNVNEIGRYRDVSLKRDLEAGLQVVIFTRMGGGNRENYEKEINFLKSKKGYVRDYDDEYDSTYANFVFEIPDKFKDLCEKVAKDVGTKQPMEKFKEMLTDMNSEKSTPATMQAKIVGEKIFSKIEKASKGDGPRVIKV